MLFERGSIGEIASHYLAMENRLEAVKFLFERGATLNTVSDVDGSPLSEAASLGYEALVEWLLANGAEIDLPGQGEPTLTNAASSGSASIVAMLLAAGADIETRSGLHETALHLAAGSDDRLEVTRLLLDAGADTAAVHWERTQLDIAIDSGATMAVALLRSRARRHRSRSIDRLRTAAIARRRAFLQATMTDSRADWRTGCRRARPRQEIFPCRSISRAASSASTAPPAPTGDSGRRSRSWPAR